MKSVSVVGCHIIKYCALTLSSRGIYNTPQKRRGIGKTSDLVLIYSGRQQKRKVIICDWLQVGLRADWVMIGRIIGRNGGKMATKTAPKQARQQAKMCLTSQNICHSTTVI